MNLELRMQNLELIINHKSFIIINNQAKSLIKKRFLNS